MPFSSTRRGGIAELPAGTHGIKDGNGTLLGKVVVIANQRETWIWKYIGGAGGMPPTGTFKVEGQLLPGGAARQAMAYEYDDAPLGNYLSRNVPASVTDGDVTYAISRTPSGGSPALIGYLVAARSSTVDLGETLTWYIGTIGNNSRIALNQGDVLTFEAGSGGATDYWCHYLVCPRKSAL